MAWSCVGLGCGCDPWGWVVCVQAVCLGCESVLWIQGCSVGQGCRSGLWVQVVIPGCASDLWVQATGVGCGSRLWVQAVGLGCRLRVALLGLAALLLQRFMLAGAGERKQSPVSVGTAPLACTCIEIVVGFAWPPLALQKIDVE